MKYYNIEPSIIVLVYRSPNTPSLDNIYLICTPKAINSCRSNCAVLGGFNCPKLNWVSNTAPPKTVDSQLLNFCSDSLLHQCILTPTRFRVNQNPSILDLICVKFPYLNELWTSFPDRISLLTSKVTPSPKAYKRPLHKPYYTRRVKRAIQRRRQAWTARKNSESSSCGAAYIRLQQEQRRSRRILLA